MSEVEPHDAEEHDARVALPPQDDLAGIVRVLLDHLQHIDADGTALKLLNGDRHVLVVTEQRASIAWQHASGYLLKASDLFYIRVKEADQLFEIRQRCRNTHGGRMTK